MSSAKKLSQARIIIMRGSHKPTELIEPPLAILRVSLMEDLNYGDAEASLASVSVGDTDGFVVAGIKLRDLGVTQIIFNVLRIPYKLLEPFTYRSLRSKEIVLDPEKEYAFACANNQELFEQIMQILQNCRTIKFPRAPKVVGSEWPDV